MWNVEWGSHVYKWGRQRESKNSKNGKNPQSPKQPMTPSFGRGNSKGTSSRTIVPSFAEKNTWGKNFSDRQINFFRGGLTPKWGAESHRRKGKPVAPGEYYSTV